MSKELTNVIPDGKLTNEEIAIINELRKVSDMFMRLPEYDKDHNDRNSFIVHVRAMQDMVNGRVAYRCNPNVYTIGQFGGLTSDFEDKQSKIRGIKVHVFKLGEYNKVIKKLYTLGAIFVNGDLCVQPSNRCWLPYIFVDNGLHIIEDDNGKQFDSEIYTRVESNYILNL